MAKDATIVIDGTSYTIPKLNIGQLEEVAEAFDGSRTKIPFLILKIAMRRATPKVDFDTLSPSMDEIGDAVQAILQTAGLQKSDANPTPLKVVGESS